MADRSKSGTDWNDEELDLVVEAYFDLYRRAPSEPRGFKAQRKRQLDAEIDRGIGSIDFKLGNLSHVATELGLPKLPGFEPASKAQNDIYDAFGRYLDAHPEAWGLGLDRLLPAAQPWGGGPRSGGGVLDAPPTAPGMAESAVEFDGESELFSLLLAETPPPVPYRAPRAEGLVRLVRKFDPAARDHRNRALGELGEIRVLQHERARLIAAGCPKLAGEIEWTSKVHGDGAGYDIRSFDPTGRERLIEVKTTRGGATTPFYLSRTEREVSMERSEDWRLYRVHDLSFGAGMFVLPPPLETSVRLEAESWKASF